MRALRNNHTTILDRAYRFHASPIPNRAERDTEEEPTGVVFRVTVQVGDLVARPSCSNRLNSYMFCPADLTRHTHCVQSAILLQDARCRIADDQAKGASLVELVRSR